MIRNQAEYLMFSVFIQRTRSVLIRNKVTEIFCICGGGCRELKENNVEYRLETDSYAKSRNLISEYLIMKR